MRALFRTLPALRPASRPPRRAAGFTLIELLITLAILAVLATAVLPVAELTMQRQKEQELRLALREIRAAIDAYKRAYDEGRMQRSVNTTGYPPSLDVLVDGVEDLRTPKRSKIYFLRRVPRDPFETNPDVSPADTWAKRAYASEPNEPREGDDIYDVMSRSTKTGLNGLPYNKW
jgi:general secretion pathway protein G